MKDIAGLLEKAAEKTGFRRDYYKEENIPTDVSNIVIAPFFGDVRSLFVLSSLLFHRYKEQDKPSKYLIICSWPGFALLFPSADEYWSLESEVHVKKILSETSGFYNKSELIGQYYRSLNQFFFEDMTPLDDALGGFYNGGLTDAFWTKYKQVIRFLPGLPSLSSLGRDFNRDFTEKGGYKVFVYPSLHIFNWHSNHTRLLKSPKDFWIALVKRLLDEKFMPVICKNFDTHDLSAEFSKNCIYFSENDIGKIMTVMRASGCVLDIFNDVSRLALAARTPFLCMSERARYVGLKDYELDDLCGLVLPKQYIFSFSTILDGGNPSSWNLDIFNLIVNKLNELLPNVDKDALPLTNRSIENVSYDLVRKKELKRLGTRLLKIPNKDG